jgi:hypothetical protein
MALDRQKELCASCGTRIGAFGERERHSHRFGEAAEGHHVIPHEIGGPVTLENCVVLCRSCHLNAHRGGQWGDVGIYDDLLDLPMFPWPATAFVRFN